MELLDHARCQPTRRSFASGTKTIRAAGSSLGVVISTIAVPPARVGSGERPLVLEEEGEIGSERG